VAQEESRKLLSLSSPKVTD